MHRTDFVALFFGLAFLAAGAGFIVHQTTGRNFDATWIAAVGLVSIGCIFLGATLLRGGARRLQSVEPVPAAHEREREPELRHETDAAMATAAGEASEETTP